MAITGSVTATAAALIYYCLCRRCFQAVKGTLHLAAFVEKQGQHSYVDFQRVPGCVRPQCSREWLSSCCCCFCCCDDPDSGWCYCGTTIKFAFATTERNCCHHHPLLHCCCFGEDPSASSWVSLMWYEASLYQQTQWCWSCFQAGFSANELVAIYPH